MGSRRVAPFPHFPRPALAQTYCDELSGTGSAVFGKQPVLLLGAPEGVGKTSFLRFDLIPEAEGRGWTIVHLDMREVGLADPELALRMLLAEVPCKEGLPEVRSGTLSTWFEALTRATAGPVLLVIDEAQQLLNTEAGRNLTFSLKAARDAVNLGGGEFYLLFAGSQRSKLSQMVATKQAAFYLSRLQELPSLGLPYVLQYVERLNTSLLPSTQLDVSVMNAAFARLGSRPDAFTQVVGQVAPFLRDERFLEVLEEAVEKALQQSLESISSQLAALTPIQRAVFSVLATREKGDSTYGHAAMERYAAELGEPVKVESVQSAIKALQEMGFIWSPGRGRYEVENPLFQAAVG